MTGTDLARPDADPGPQQWERQPGESPQAFAAFACYRDMGPDRSVTRVAQELDRSRTLIGRWSGRHRWVDRAAAYDASLDQQWRGEVIARRTIAARRQADVADQLMKAALKGLAKIDAEELSALDLVRFAELAGKIEDRLYTLTEPEKSQNFIVVFDEALKFSPVEPSHTVVDAAPVVPITRVRSVDSPPGEWWDRSG